MSRVVVIATVNMPKQRRDLRTVSRVVGIMSRQDVHDFPFLHVSSRRPSQNPLKLPLLLLLGLILPFLSMIHTPAV